MSAHYTPTTADEIIRDHAEKVRRDASISANAPQSPPEASSPSAPNLLTRVMIAEAVADTPSETTPVCHRCGRSDRRGGMFLSLDDHWYCKMIEGCAMDAADAKRASPTTPEGGTTTLKPCPFCGGAARLTKNQGESLWSHNIVWWASVKCTDCEAERGSECDDPDGVKATVAWNERATLAAPASAPPEEAEGLDDMPTREEIETLCDAAEAANARILELDALVATLTDRVREVEEWQSNAKRVFRVNAEVMQSLVDEHAASIARLEEELRAALNRLAIHNAVAPQDTREGLMEALVASEGRAVELEARLTEARVEGERDRERLDGLLLSIREHIERGHESRALSALHSLSNALSANRPSEESTNG